MKKELEYVIDKLVHYESFTYDSLINSFTKHSDLILKFKDEIIKDEKSENHDLIIKYILKQSKENKKEIFEDICKIYRKPFITHRISLSRIIIANAETFLHILKNDKRFFINGPEKTSVDIIEDELGLFLSTLYPNCFSKHKKLRKKETYNALVTLEDISDPPLIITTKLRPGTGFGSRRRKRYCLTDYGLNEIIPIISLVIRDELEKVRVQI